VCVCVCVWRQSRRSRRSFGARRSRSWWSRVAGDWYLTGRRSWYWELRTTVFTECITDRPQFTAVTTVLFPHPWVSTREHRVLESKSCGFMALKVRENEGGPWKGLEHDLWGFWKFWLDNWRLFFNLLPWYCESLLDCCIFLWFLSLN